MLHQARLLIPPQLRRYRTPLRSQAQAQQPVLRAIATMQVLAQAVDTATLVMLVSVVTIMQAQDLLPTMVRQHVATTTQVRAPAPQQVQPSEQPRVQKPLVTVEKRFKDKHTLTAQQALQELTQPSTDLHTISSTTSRAKMRIVNTAKVAS